MKTAHHYMMMLQHQQMKTKHPDAIILMREGDFYKTYNQDAKDASEILGITLSYSANKEIERTLCAGFPHYNLDSYLPKLVRAGKRVAICEEIMNLKCKLSKAAEDIDRAGDKSALELKKWMFNTACPKMERFFSDLAYDMDKVDEMKIGDVAYWFFRKSGTSMYIEKEYEFCQDYNDWRHEIEGAYAICKFPLDIFRVVELDKEKIIQK